MVLHKQVMGSQEVGYTNDQLLGLSMLYLKANPESKISVKSLRMIPSI